MDKMSWDTLRCIKLLNKEAGLDSFVILVGTGLSNVHMNLEALARHTKHTQFITFHREDANKEVETGKLRETTSFFIAAYFFCQSLLKSLQQVQTDWYTLLFKLFYLSKISVHVDDTLCELRCRQASEHSKRDTCNQRLTDMFA